ncbi:hypothetical protein PEDI_41700 [Persicobacter diffluens]|uniref:Uncharacterized protein n=1 Tax=Persicobacter diffluens TaxID=981 RepID=A0AAN4W2V1_9BACT|nr:hypothetical protein PEDI_41700 [Persicobacter diffluens]
MINYFGCTLMFGSVRSCTCFIEQLEEKVDLQSMESLLGNWHNPYK